MTITRPILTPSADTDNIIINLSDAYTLINLSRVSRNTYTVLSNDFFERRFAALYPFFKALNTDPCPTLQTCQPESCWKIMCCIALDANNGCDVKICFLEGDNVILQIFHSSLGLNKSNNGNFFVQKD